MTSRATQFPPTPSDEETWSRTEPAWGRFLEGVRSGIRRGCAGEIRAKSLVDVKERLEAYKREIEDGNRFGILLAVQECAAEGVPLPDWLAQMYSSAIESLLAVNSKVHSLDEIFPSPNLSLGRTASKTAAARRDWALGVELWQAVWQHVLEHSEVMGIDPALRAVLKGKKWGVGTTTARKLLIRVDESQSSKTGSQSLSRFLEIRRKR